MRDSALAGESSYVGGKPGTGKSATLQAVRKALEAAGHKVAVVASTGIAAAAHNASTLNSWSGIGLGEGDVKTLLENQTQLGKRNIASADWLLIDEGSMIDADLFDKLDEVACNNRNDLTRPFGGLKIQFYADFLQLPPIRRHTVTDNPNFAFKAHRWQALFPRSFYLTNVFRQADANFLHALDEARCGQYSMATRDFFQSRVRSLGVVSVIDACWMFARRDKADEMNEERLNALTGEQRVFAAEDSVLDESYRHLLDEMNRVAPPDLKLKINAAVLFTRNLPALDVRNGDRGIVTGFMQGGIQRSLFSLFMACPERKM